MTGPISLTDLIDFRAFSSAWFWILLAIYWTAEGSRVLGIPYDMVNRARRDGGMSLTQVEHLAHIFSARVLRLGGVWPVAGLAVACFVLTGLILLGYVYGFELAQAALFFALPAVILGTQTRMLAHKVYDNELLGEDLIRALTRHRLRVQVTGMVFIFVSALWGMYWLLARGI